MELPTGPLSKRCWAQHAVWRVEATRHPEQRKFTLIATMH